MTWSITPKNASTSGTLESSSDVVTKTSGSGERARATRVDFRVMSYNAHACRGSDGHLDVARVADVILEQDPDVVTLQELDAYDPRSNCVHQPQLLGELTGRSVHFHAARAALHAKAEGAGEPGRFGNATLCRYPFELIGEGGLPAKRDESRAAHLLRVTLRDGCWINLVNTHLSIVFRERLNQVKAILSEEDPVERTAELFSPLVAPFHRLVLCGDFNAGGWSPVARWLRGKLRDAQSASPGRKRATWPARFPFLRLDHIWVGPEVEVRHAFVPSSPLSRIASDHRPLVADLSVTRVSAD